MTEFTTTVKNKVKRLSRQFMNEDDDLILDIVDVAMLHFNQYTNVPDNQEIDVRYAYIIVDVTSRFYAERRRRFKFEESKIHFDKFMPILKDEFTLSTLGIAKQGRSWSS